MLAQFGRSARVPRLWGVPATMVLLGATLWGPSSACRATEPEAAQQPGWELVWSDEFDGDELDVTKWAIEVNAFGGGNHELQIYTDRSENVRLRDGLLILEARRDHHDIAGTKREFSSGRVRTKRRGDWKYGKVEVRAKLPRGQGLWPAIWMLPTDERYGGWAASGEIDIMEFKGQEPAQYWGTLHYGGGWPNNKHTGEIYRMPAGQSLCEDFHTYGMEWREGEIRWLIDGKVWQTQTKWDSSNGKFPAPFDQRFHLILNLAVGGQFVGPPDTATPLPAQFQVDYVRVYQATAD